MSSVTVTGFTVVLFLVASVVPGPGSSERPESIASPSVLSVKHSVPAIPFAPCGICEVCGVFKKKVDDQGFPNGFGWFYMVCSYGDCALYCIEPVEEEVATLEPGDLEWAWTTVLTEGMSGVERVLQAFPTQASLEESRNSLQLRGCGGAIVANIPIESR